MPKLLALMAVDGQPVGVMPDAIVALTQHAKGTDIVTTLHLVSGVSITVPGTLEETAKQLAPPPDGSSSSSSVDKGRN